MTVACLPVAGRENPYQFLMMQGLRAGGLEVFHGHRSKFFGILLTGFKRPDYIHFDWETNYYLRRAGWMTLLNLPLFFIQVLFVRYILRVQLVWTPHNVRPHDSGHTGLHRVCRRFFAAQMKWVRVFSERTIPKMAQELSLDPAVFKVMPEGSYLGFYPDATNRTEARQKVGLSEADTVFLYLGYIKPYKGILEMIEAFNRQFKSEVLLIAGQIMDKAYGLQVLSHQSNRIRVIDQFIADQDVQYYMHAADAVVLPFKQIENSGSVILAMGFGKLILAPSMGVVVDRLSNQKELLYKHEVSESFQAWSRLTAEERTSMGLANRRALDAHQWRDFSNLFLSR